MKDEGGRKIAAEESEGGKNVSAALSSLLLPPSSFLKCRARGLVLGVGARLNYPAHLADDVLHLLVLRVEVGRDADARAGAVVNDGLAADEFARDGGRVRGGDGDGAAAAGRVARAGDSEAGLFGQLDEELRLPHAFGANPLDADLVDDPVAGLRRVERGDGGRAVEEARDPFGVAYRRVLEGERRGARHPAPGLRLQGLLQARRDVEVARAGAAAEPLHRAARCEVNVQLLDAERDSSGGLVCV